MATRRDERDENMPFVKLDCGILDSTLWVDRECREIFITALLLAEPFEARQEMPQLQIYSLDHTGWCAPPGWYGFVPAAGVGIARRAMMDYAQALPALERLGSPDPESRSSDFEGRRLIRVDGGFLVLNYFKYRERDYTTAERSKRYRERKKAKSGDSPRRDATTSHRDITQAEAEAEADQEKESSLRLDGVCKDVWQEFVEHRKSIRKPLTALSAQKNANILAGLSPADQRRAVDTTIANNWVGIFPPKAPHGTSQAPRPTSAVDRVRAAAAERERAARAAGRDY